MVDLSREQILRRLGLYSVDFNRMSGDSFETYKTLINLDMVGVPPDRRVTIWDHNV